MSLKQINQTIGYDIKQNTVSVCVLVLYMSPLQMLLAKASHSDSRHRPLVWGYRPKMLQKALRSVLRTQCLYLAMSNHGSHKLSVDNNVDLYVAYCLRGVILLLRWLDVCSAHQRRRPPAQVGLNATEPFGR